MPNLLQQLENNEAVLLMYLADELHAEDRAEVDQLLAVDASLREDLQSLRAAWDASLAVVDQVHRSTPPPVSEDVAVRTVMRRMRKKFLEDQSRPITTPEAPGKGVPRWLIGAVAAGLLLVSYVAWWGLRSDPLQGPEAGGFVQNEEDLIAEPTLESLAIEQTASALREDWAGSDDTLNMLAQPLSEAEVLLALLSNSSDHPNADFLNDLLEPSDNW